MPLARLAVRTLSYDQECSAFLHRGAWWVICPECDGTGLFLLPDDSGIPCNYCKTKGLVPVALEGEI